MTCQQKLIAEGTPFPRTCEECGLGPCKKYEYIPKDDKPPVDVWDCKCLGSLFIESGSYSGTGQTGHHHISVCPDCGTINVVGTQNGQHYRHRIRLATPEQVKAAGRYLQGLETP